MFNKFNHLLINNLEKLRWVNRTISLASLFLIYSLFTDEEFSLNWSWNFLGVTLMIMIGYFFHSLSWSFIISNKISYDKIFSWFLSLIGKYLPFKLGIPIMRVTKDVQNTEVDTKKYFLGVIYEVLYQVTSGGIIVAMYFIAGFYNIPFLLLISIFLLILFAIYKTSYSRKPIILFTSFLGYVMFIISIDFLARLAGYEASLDIAIAYTASAIISLFFVGAPAGIGIREYIFITFFNSNEIFATVDFLQIALIIRIVYIFTDFFSYSLFKLLEFRDNRKL